MNLSYLINELKIKFNDIRDYKAYVIKLNPDKNDDYLELSIKDVQLDEDADEINIFIHDRNDSLDANQETINVEQLLNKLEALMPKAADFSLFVSYPTIDLDDKYIARLDVPIVAHGFSNEKFSFGLLEQERKKQDT